MEEMEMQEMKEEKVIDPKLGDVFRYSDYMPYLAFAQAHGYQIIDYGMDGEEKLFMVREMPVIEPTKEQLAKSRIRKLKKFLSETDYKAIKYAEGVIIEEEYAPIRLQRQEWRDEINALEEEYIGNELIGATLE